ncbi:MAG: hypothetical protein KKG50_04610, partial [Candidatus Omnitrophica bacterium]|nr:hypothetical protein [Candidatus Omnitrophota bacterium]
DVIPIEIKSNVRINNVSIRGLLDFLKLKIPKRILFGVVFYRGDRIFRLTEKILAIPVGYL